MWPSLPTQTPLHSLFDASFWIVDSSISRHRAYTWSKSRLFKPNYNLHGYFTSDLYNYEDTWINYAGDTFDTLIWDWQKLVPTHQPLTLKQFFVYQQIDTPIFLKLKRQSLRPESQYPSERLVGMLARHGKHRRIWSYYLNIYNTLIRDFFFPTQTPMLTRQTIPLLNVLFFQPSQTFLASTYGFYDYTYSDPKEKFESGELDTRLLMRFKDLIEDGEIEYNLDVFFYRAFYSQLHQYLPIFAMKFKKVDKLKFKHSRGKSGKYTVEWKFIPVYRRIDIVLRWLVDDIILQKAFRFKTQMRKSIHLLLTNPDATVVKKNRDFVHFYVYARYKNSLIRTLKKL